MTNSARPPDVPWLVPYLAVSDVEKALDFYTRAFGFERGRVLTGPDGSLGHATLHWHDSRIMIGPEDRVQEAGLESPLGRTPRDLGGAGLVLYVYDEDVDALYQRAVAGGATEGFPPRDMSWGDRVCLLFDPDGHAWNFATHFADF